MGEKKERNEKFRSLLKEKDLHGAQLARKLGVDRRMVSFWVRGELIPRTIMIPKIAKALDVSIEEIMSCFVEV